MLKIFYLANPQNLQELLIMIQKKKELNDLQSILRKKFSN